MKMPSQLRKVITAPRRSASATTSQLSVRAITFAIGLCAAIVGFQQIALAQNPAIDSLYKEAQKESRVVSQGPWTVQQMEPLIASFEARYPGVKVAYTNQTAGQTVTQLVTEAAAGNITIDAPLTYLPLMGPLLDRNILMPFDGWSQLGVGADQILLDGKYVYRFDSPIVLAYNTDLVSQADLPHKWDDLLSPKWKDGKLILDSRGYFISGLALPEGLGLNEVLRISSGLKSQNPIYVARNATALDQLSAGQAPLAAVLSSLLYSAKSRGAPVALVPITPVYADSFGLSVTARAAHPSAAKLWIVWLGSDEARKLLDKVGLGFVRPCTNTEIGKALCDAHAKIVLFRNLEEATLVTTSTIKVQDALGTRAK